ncbi:MAG: hypothetical protein KF753_21990 [Caldilineaceae bacterium]|nr:hypothetical protein [Caldilineaceae bacterium]
MRKDILTLLLALTLALAACTGGSTPAPAPATAAARDTPVPTAVPTTASTAPEPTAVSDQSQQSQPSAQATGEKAEPFGGGPALTVEQVKSIETYRMHVEVMSDGEPSAIIDVAHVKNPIAEDDRVTLYQKGEPTTLNVRYVGETLYINNGEKWAVISTFNLAELTVITPAGMAPAAPLLTQVGTEEVSGRQTIHLRGDKEVIPDIQAGNDSLSVKSAESAQLDLWLDADERFIVKLLFSVTLEGKTFTTEFLYQDFNEAIVVEVPTNVEEVASPATPMPSEIVALLGFDFPIPPDAQLSVVANTANIVTSFGVAEARTHLEEAMVAAGFTQVGEPEERAKDEFFYTFQQDDRTVTANVFSVVAGKTTIQIGAAK